LEINKFFLENLRRDENYMLWMQANLIKIYCPYIEVKTHDNKLMGRFFYNQPCFQNTYEVYIFYESFFHPKVMVENPKIKPNHLIHLNSDGSLCLYHPNDYKYGTYQNLAFEIVPWTIKWIHYYELWLVNGNIWKGDEASHGIIR
jgi:hypothetical protein